MTQGFDVDQEGIFLPIIDARRNEVYTSVFDKYKNKITPTQAKILNQNSFQEYSKNKVYIFGDGAYKAKKILSISASYFPEFYPSSRYMSFLSENLFKEESFENLDSFEPFYLKDFVGGK